MGFINMTGGVLFSSIIKFFPLQKYNIVSLYVDDIFTFNIIIYSF